MQREDSTPTPLSLPRAYDPERAYDLMAHPEVTDAQLVNLLIERLRPFLSPEVLGREEMPTRVERIQDIMAHYGEHAAQFTSASSRRSSSRSETPAAARIGQIRARHEAERVADAEILDVLGFLPKSTFSRGRSVAEGGHSEHDVATAPLATLIPNWFPVDRIDHYAEVLPTLTQDQMAQSPRLIRLVRWMRDAQADVRESLDEAFSFIDGTLIPKLVTNESARQPFSSFADLSTRGLTNLMDIFWDREQSMRKRFEALRLLIWGIALYSIRSNPIFEAHNQVRAEVEDLLAESVWDSGNALGPMAIPRSVVAHLMQEELGEEGMTASADWGQEGEIGQRARLVSHQTRQILAEAGELISQPDRLLYAARAKTPLSAVLKLVTRDAHRAVCEGILTSYDADDEARGFARKKLAEMRARLANQGLPDATIDVRPVSLESIDDNVGFTLVVNISKPLDQFDQTERNQLTDVMTSLSRYLTEQLGLQDVQFENYLWDSNEGNTHSSGGFRVAKLQGMYPVELARPLAGGEASSKKPVRVPVEVQILAAETHLRKQLPGKTGVSAYKERQVETVAGAVMPRRIGPQDIFPPLGSGAMDPERLAALLQ
ncbi:hypothetical protein CO046_03070 [Candidatus Peregrinibacteria bacterium CG_4_9_14_0_2_um_filter_53_11]|nr:MAG: hypothetical protein CO046_03070 [Candidatus Peregrinibacteria bacterium CG_4_9_14_0_2_um_filter_53_11]